MLVEKDCWVRDFESFKYDSQELLVSMDEYVKFGSRILFELTVGMKRIRVDFFWFEIV